VMDVSLFYVAFILDRDCVHEAQNRSTVVMQGGVDLLAGPYQSEEAAKLAVPDACEISPRATFTAWLAQLRSISYQPPLARIEIIEVNREQVKRYNARHAREKGIPKLPWPPPALWGEAAIPNVKGKKKGKAL